MLRAAFGPGQEPDAGDEGDLGGAEALLGLRPHGRRQERGRPHPLQRPLRRTPQAGHIHHHQTRQVIILKDKLDGLVKILQ